MRKILLVRGAQGAGKSTWLKQNGFEQYTISTDSIRLLFGSPVYNSDGNFTIPQDQNKRVFDFIYDIAKQRMDKGEFFVVDATFSKVSDFTMWQKLASEYHYSLGCVDFSNVPLDVCKERNAQRESYKFVPNEIIEKFYENIQRHDVPKSVKKLSPCINEVHEWLDVKTVDLSSYTKVVHIGDIQGCYTPVKEYFDSNPFSDSTYYIFTGDFIDRGIENGEVMRWAIDTLVNKRNVTIIMGNHELHLRRWASDQVCVSNEFEANTLPQMLEHNITKESVYAFVRKMVDVFKYTFNGKEVIVSHAGVSTIPKKMWEVTSKSFWNGSGSYGEPVDKQFTENNPDKIQVHGHRNKHKLPVQAAENSFNLEASVEFGGNLRILTIEKDA